MLRDISNPCHFDHDLSIIYIFLMFPRDEISARRT